MADFKPYITYSEYKGLGGTVPESAFPNLERKAQRKLDYFTHNRIESLTTIPDEVKEVLTEYINVYYVAETQTAGNVASYSNGTESFTYKDVVDVNSSQFTTNLFRIAVEYLSIELISQVMNYGD